MRIICDTSVWYWIGEEFVDIQNLISLGHKLVATGVTIEEFISSPVLIEKPDRYKKAVLAMFEFADEFITEDPIDHLVKLHIPKFKGQSEDFEKAKNLLKMIENFDPKNPNNNEQTNAAFESYIKKINKPYEEYADSINKYLVSKKKENKDKNVTSHQIRSNDATNEFLLMAMEIINERASTEGYSIESFRTTDFELFTRGYENYIKEKLAVPNSVSKKNDIYDLHQFAYVESASRYLTFDTKEPNKVMFNREDALKFFVKYQVTGFQ